MPRHVRGNHMIKVKLLTVLTAVFLIGVSACSSGHNAVTGSVTTPQEGESSAVEYKKITAEEAKAMIDAGNVIILDVRTQEEYDAGHIEDAVRMEAADFSSKAATVLPDKDANILVYCRSGNRSKTATKMLIELGYTQVYDFGGINDWPYDTVK